MNPAVHGAIRLPLIALHLLIGAAATMLLLWPIAWRGGPGAGNARSRVVSLWCRVLCRIVGLRVRVTGESLQRPTLFVCNHVSWLDIIGLLATSDALFLSKAGVRRWPLIGWLVAQAGTLFITRGALGAAGKAIADIGSVLSSGRSVVIFPEGTSTDGAGVGYFHPRLFEAAIASAVPVQAIAIRYTDADGGRSVVAPFIGEDDFVAHLSRVTGTRYIDMTCTVCPVVDPAGRDRRALADITHDQISLVLDGFCDAALLPTPAAGPTGATGTGNDSLKRAVTNEEM